MIRISKKYCLNSYIAMMPIILILILKPRYQVSLRRKGVYNIQKIASNRELLIHLIKVLPIHKIRA